MEPYDTWIAAVGTALPGPPIDNATLTRRFAMPAVWEQWIGSFIGTRTRHFSFDLGTGEVRSTLADLGATAGERAMAKAGVRPADVDLLMLGTSSPDRLMPATVNVIADRLGIDGISTYQFQSGCAGALQALDVANQLLRSGRHRTALVLGGDRCAKHFDVTADITAMPPAEQVNGALFGDGAGAAVLRSGPAPAGATLVRHVFVQLAGAGRAPGQIVEWFGRADRDTDRPAFSEDYKAIEQSVPVMAAEVLDAMLDELGWKESDVDYLLPPQLSGRMTERISERLALTGASEVSCVADTGNTGNALPFFQLEMLLPRMTDGDRALGIAIESSKWIKSGIALERL
jgi:3-oxoacyl-[acyl-carrier-protein] synthase-3